MTDHAWHAPTALLDRYAADPASVDDLAATSIEEHLLACSHCRAVLTSNVDASVVTESWASVADRIDEPRRRGLERALARLGVSDELGRLVGASPALRLATVLATAVLATGAAVVSRTADAQGPFLVLAPIIPLVMVAAAFAPASDPAGEAGVATPMFGAGLILRRGLVVGTATFLILGGASLALPDLGPAAVAWVLPALALAFGALALGTWLRIEAAVGILVAAWTLGLWSVWYLAGHNSAVADTTVFTSAGQLAAAALAVIGGALLVVRRERLSTMEVFQ